MNRRDFLKVIGADEKAVEYLPVACLLRSGYGCAGYFNTSLNQALDEVCTLLNARLIPLQSSGSTHREHGAVRDFNEFIEEVVLQYFKGGDDAESPMPMHWGRNIPLASLRFDEIAVLYPVAHIGQMMRGLRPTIEETFELQEEEPVLIEDDAAPATTPARPKPVKPVIVTNPDAVPSFLDFDRKSVIISMLRKKLW